jgi:hypothetical protein
MDGISENTSIARDVFNKLRDPVSLLRRLINDGTLSQQSFNKLISDVINAVSPIMNVKTLYKITEGRQVYTGKQIKDVMDKCDTIKYDISVFDSIKDELRSLKFMMDRIKMTKFHDISVDTDQQQKIQHAIEHVTKLAEESKEKFDKLKELLADSKLIK